MPRIHLLPDFKGADNADGGIRRVVEAQRRYLPALGWEFMADPAGADIVATHAGMRADIPATTPLVNHCHGLYWTGYSWVRWALSMNRDVIKAMRRADVVTAPSEWVAQAVRRGTWLDPQVLYHGVEPDDWSPPDRGGHGGYVLWNKTRVDAVCDPEPVFELAKRARDVQFVTTLPAAQSLPMSNVTVSGVVDYSTAKQYIQYAGVYLATSRETFGIGTLEAMACGVPVLGWDWGGQREIVTHGVDGWLSPEGNYDDLLAGLRWCLAHRDDAGDCARERVLGEFTWDIAIQRYDDLYRRLLYRDHGINFPPVTVVIPAYNMAELLPSAVESVKSQSDQSWELVIVDDASTDGTGAIADALAAEYNTPGQWGIRVIHNETNQYLAEALNVGISAAGGRYILPLDADNLLAPGALGLLRTALDADRDIDIAYGAMSVIESDGREWTSTWPTEFEYRRQMKHQNQIPSTSMYRRSTWERVGGYRRRCRTAEDADFWCRATSYGANARKVTDAVVLRYRNRSDSMSHQVADWGWHEWYPWGASTDQTPWIAPVDGEASTIPVIYTHEFPIISVVIPVGEGHGRLVLDALDSLQAQSFPWWEAIVVDDTVDGIPWLPTWARVTRPTAGGGGGAGSARNAGMLLAHGQLFLFLDADDYLQPRALELMAATYQKVGGFVYGDWYVQETGELKLAPEWDGCESVLSQLPWPVTCLYPRAVWDTVGRMDTDLPAWEDWDFAIRVVRAGYCGTRVAAPVFHYRMGSGARREVGFANRDELKKEIMARWAPYITKEVAMPCGCSGGGGSLSLPTYEIGAPSTLPPPNGSTDDMVLLEFTDDVSAPITYTGKATGTHYRFGSDDDNRIRYVLRPDAEHFLARDEFQLYGGVDSSPQLAAAGPPRTA